MFKSRDLFMKQVFDNLVSNAAKYAPNSPLIMRVFKEENGVSIDVKDTGPGIPSRDLDRIFERFYRSEANSQDTHGSGLGLFICKKIIEAHDGQINVTSILGKGTTFHVFLPLSESESS